MAKDDSVEESARPWGYRKEQFTQTSRCTLAHKGSFHTNTHTECADGLHCRDAHGNKMDTPLKGDQRSLEIECKHSQKTFARGSRSWHGLFQCISIFEMSVGLAVWIHKVNVPVSVFI